jgi:hypothetical protein
VSVLPPARGPLAALRGRLALSFAGLALLGVGVTAFFVTSALRGAMLDLVAVGLLDQAAVLAERVRGPLADEDPAALAEAMAAIDRLTHARAG